MGVEKAIIQGPPGYRTLQTKVRSILSEGLERAQRVVEQERIRTYWELGGVLDAYLEEHGSGYGDYVYKMLSSDTDISARVLYDTVIFHRIFRIVPAQANLTWTHYRGSRPR